MALSIVLRYPGDTVQGRDGEHKAAEVHNCGVRLMSYTGEPHVTLAQADAFAQGFLRGNNDTPQTVYIEKRNDLPPSQIKVCSDCNMHRPKQCLECRNHSNWSAKP